MKNNKFTYQKSGVNIHAADRFVNFIARNTGKKKQKNKNIGGFGSISSIPKYFKDPKIVASTDGVGTKIEIANILNKFDTIGIDLVAMCVNDLIVQGAKPLFFLDYISINKINLKKLKSILKGSIKDAKFLIVIWRVVKQLKCQELIQRINLILQVLQLELLIKKIF